MPLLTTRGGLSARGFGELNGGRPRTLQTYTFPAGSSVFTVPATTNTLVSAVGAGADGSPASSGTYRGSFWVTYLNGDGNLTNGTISLTYEDCKAQQQAVYNAMLALPDNAQMYYTRQRYLVGPNNKCIVYTAQDSTSPIVKGSVVLDTSFYYLTGPVNFVPSGLGFGYYISHETRYDNPATTGASTTGFGLTFPGGNGGASSTTTFNNVAVTPNQTYVITNNKSLTITYYA